MKNPSVKEVPSDSWYVEYESDLVKVESAEVSIQQLGQSYNIVPLDTHGSFRGEFWKVTNLETKKVKTFFGETAWSDARRFASDLDFGAWSI